MLLAHKIELRPTLEQTEYLDKACGCRRHCYNQLLAHFMKDGVNWSKKAAQQYYMKVLRVEFPWYNEVFIRATENAINDLDNAYSHFFRRVKLGQKPGYPKFKKKNINDSFTMREVGKKVIEGRKLKISRLGSTINMRQKVRFEGKVKRVTVSKRAGKYFASILVETDSYDGKNPEQKSVGVDFGIKDLATCSNGKVFPANQKLKASLRKLKRKQRQLSRKKKGSNRRAKAKQAVAKLHYRISNQRSAVLHQVSDYLTKTFKLITIEDLNVKGMVKNHKLARAVSDAGFYMLRSQIEYKANLRNVDVVIADRWFPSSKICSNCGEKNSELVLGVSEWVCQHCNTAHDRDLNAAINLENYSQ